MPKDEKDGAGLVSSHLRHIYAAASNSLAGFKTAWREEKAFQQIVLCAVLGAPTALWLADSWLEFIILILPLILAMIVELLNTAIENVVDLASPQWHSLAKKAKDMASAAQFCSQMLAAIIWSSRIICKIIG